MPGRAFATMIDPASRPGVHRFSSRLSIAWSVPSKTLSPKLLILQRNPKNRPQKSSSDRGRQCWDTVPFYSGRKLTRKRKFEAINEISAQLHPFSSPVVAAALGHSHHLKIICTPLTQYHLRLLSQPC